MNFSVLKKTLLIFLIFDVCSNQQLITGSDFIDQKVQELLNSLDLGHVVTGRRESIILPEGTIEKTFVDENPVVITGADKLEENVLESKVNNNAYSEKTLQQIADFIDPLAREVKLYNNSDFQRTQVTVEKPFMDTQQPLMMQPTVVQLGPDGNVIGQAQVIQQVNNNSQDNELQAQQVYQQQLLMQNQPNYQQQQQANYQQQQGQQQQQDSLFKIENPEQYFQDIINQSRVNA